MKGFCRAVASILFCTLLIMFSLWRNESLPDLTRMTAFVQNAAGRINDIKTQLEQITGIPPLKKPSDEGAEFPEYTLSEKLDEGLESTLCNGYDQLLSSIDISAYALSLEEAQAVVSRNFLSHPEYFYVGTSCSYQTTGSGNSKIVTAILPAYLYDKETIADMTVTYNEAVAAIVAGAPTQGNDFDKLLYLHDYFIENYRYDYTYTIRDAYTFFTQKTGVCQAYMLALIATAGELGIESIPVTSTPMKHAWNLVKLDGEWYHIDITWDDSVSLPSHTSYTYFLQSDIGLATIDKNLTEPHRDWQTTAQAESTKYDAAMWRNSSTQMLKLNGIYYCTVPDGAADRYALYGGSDPAVQEKKATINAIWRTGNSDYSYTSCYADLAIWQGLLLYNTSNALYTYNPSTGESRIVALLSVSSNMNVYGIDSVTNDGTVRYIMDGRDFSGIPLYGTHKIAV